MQRTREDNSSITETYEQRRDKAAKTHIDNLIGETADGDTFSDRDKRDIYKAGADWGREDTLQLRDDMRDDLREEVERLTLERDVLSKEVERLNGECHWKASLAHDAAKENERLKAELAEANRKIECFEEALDGTVEGWRESPLAKNLAKRQGEPAYVGVDHAVLGADRTVRTPIEPAKCECGLPDQQNPLCDPHPICECEPAPADAVSEPRVYRAYLDQHDAFLTLSSSGSKNPEVILIEKRAYDALSLQCEALAEALKKFASDAGFHTGGNCTCRLCQARNSLVAYEQFKKEQGK